MSLNGTPEAGQPTHMVLGIQRTVSVIKNIARSRLRQYIICVVLLQPGMSPHPHLYLVYSSPAYRWGNYSSKTDFYDASLPMLTDEETEAEE